MSKNTNRLLYFVGMLLIFSSAIIASTMNSTNLYLDHAGSKTLSVKIILDNKVLFEGLIKQSKRMPPIVYSKILNLSAGSHNLKFEDRTRRISEEKKFLSPDIKTIFIKTEKDLLTKTHIVLETKDISVK